VLIVIALVFLQLQFLVPIMIDRKSVLHSAQLVLVLGALVSIEGCGGGGDDASSLSSSDPQPSMLAATRVSLPQTPLKVTLEGMDEKGFNPMGAPITFRLSCHGFNQSAGSVTVFDNGTPLPREALRVTADSVTIALGLDEGRHQLKLQAVAIDGRPIEKTVQAWVGNAIIPLTVLDEAGNPASGARVLMKLGDDPQVRANLVTDGGGTGLFQNLPYRSFNLIATTADNKLGTRPASVIDGAVTMRLNGFRAASSIDNNNFAQGTAGWEIGAAPVAVLAHVEGNAGTVSPATPDYDLRLTTSGERQQSVSRTFEAEAGVRSVSVRYRYITEEVPAGWFGNQFNDFYNVSIRTRKAGGLVIDGNSLNGLGLSKFDSAGATGWFELEIPIAPGGDTVQVDAAVANVADGLLDSYLVVDRIEKKYSSPRVVRPGGH
jgi:hypothetical protein